MAEQICNYNNKNNFSSAAIFNSISVIHTRSKCSLNDFDVISYKVMTFQLKLIVLFSSHIPMSVDGVEIIVNGSGSYMELRKAYVTVDLVKSATFKVK